MKIKNTKIKRWLATSKKDPTKKLESDVPGWAVACSFIFPMTSESRLLHRDHRYEYMFGSMRWSHTDEGRRLCPVTPMATDKARVGKMTES